MKKLLLNASTLIGGMVVLVSHFAVAAPPPPSIPVDGGAGLLAAAGIAFGVKKIVDYRRKQAK